MIVIITHLTNISIHSFRISLISCHNQIVCDVTGRKCDINYIMQYNKNYYRSQQYVIIIIQPRIIKTNYLRHKAK